MYIKPTPGRLLRDPRSMARVPPEGMFVPDMDPHWMTAIRFGDAEVIMPPPPAPPVAAEPLPEAAPAATEENV